MTSKFYKLKISKIIRETKDSVTISFDVPINLHKVFEYKHGQYLTLKIHYGNENHRRAFSISSSPYLDESLSITVKSLNDGYISKYLNEEIQVGDYIDLLPPMGHFTIELNANYSRDHVMFGGGSGITPIFSILKSILLQEPKSRVFLFYSNKNEDSIIFKNQLNKLVEKFKNNFHLVHILSNPQKKWLGLHGRLNKQMIISLLKQYIPSGYMKAEYYLCGPGGMNQEVFSALELINTDQSRIHKESYTIPLTKVIEGDKEIPKKLELVTRKVKIILYGEEHEFDVDPSESVLTAAMGEGHDPPFSCQIGACSSCRAKLLSGKVYMDEREALTDDEITQGFVLTCQSHPITENVVIDYDD